MFFELDSYYFNYFYSEAAVFFLLGLFKPSFLFYCSPQVSLSTSDTKSFSRFRSDLR